jgi:MFS family permease
VRSIDILHTDVLWSVHPRYWGGGIMVILLTEILVKDLVPLREEGKFFSMISIMQAAGSVSGPVVGGAFPQSGARRWIF